VSKPRGEDAYAGEERTGAKKEDKRNQGGGIAFTGGKPEHLGPAAEIKPPKETSSFVTGQKEKNIGKGKPAKKETRKMGQPQVGLGRAKVVVGVGSQRGRAVAILAGQGLRG